MEDLRQVDVLTLLRRAQDRGNAPLRISFESPAQAKSFGGYVRLRHGVLTFEGKPRDEVFEEIEAEECTEVLVRLNPGLESSSMGSGVHLDRLASHLSLCASYIEVLDEARLSQMLRVSTNPAQTRVNAP